MESERRAYIYYLKGRTSSAVIGSAVALLSAVALAVYLIVAQAYNILYIPAIWTVIGIFFLFFGKINRKEFIAISSDGIKMLGVQEQVGNKWVNTNLVVELSWTQIKEVEYTRHFVKSTRLFINLLDGQRYLFVLGQIDNAQWVIEKLREYVTCNDLGSSNANHHQCLR